MAVPGPLWVRSSFCSFLSMAFVRGDKPHKSRDSVPPEQAAAEHGMRRNPALPPFHDRQTKLPA
jgi:hypothetical protein